MGSPILAFHKTIPVEALIEYSEPEDVPTYTILFEETVAEALIEPSNRIDQVMDFGEFILAAKKVPSRAPAKAVIPSSAIAGVTRTDEVVATGVSHAIIPVAAVRTRRLFSSLAI
jgi:hypothetical protein